MEELVNENSTVEVPNPEVEETQKESEMYPEEEHTETEKKSKRGRKKAEDVPASDIPEEISMEETEETSSEMGSMPQEEDFSEDDPSDEGYDQEQEEPSDEEFFPEDDMKETSNETDGPKESSIKDKYVVNGGIFDKRRVYRMSDEERENEYRHKEKIVSEKGQYVKTHEDYLKDEYQILKAASRSVPKTILGGVLTGITHDEDERIYMTVLLDNSKGLYRILIPVCELFPVDFSYYAKYGADGEKYLTNELKSRIGGHIEFTVYKLLEREKTAIVSRVEAMEIKSFEYFRKKQSDGKPDIVDGEKAVAKIINVRRDRITVEIMGAETVIPWRELSWLSLSALQDEFKKGDEIIVKVSNIKTFDYLGEDKRKHVLVSLDASKRAAEKNPAEIYYDYFNIGDTSMGVITNVNDEKGVFIRLQDKMDCLCPFPSMGQAEKGKPCVVSITRKTDADKRIFGRIVSMQ